MMKNGLGYYAALPANPTRREKSRTYSIGSFNKMGGEEKNDKCGPRPEAGRVPMGKKVVSQSGHGKPSQKAGTRLKTPLVHHQ
jgi:hypothetical protein